jgi:hypothetical protein
MVLVELARIVNETPKPMEIIAHDSHSNSQAGKRRIYFTKKKKKHILVHTEPKRNSIQSSAQYLNNRLGGVETTTVNFKLKQRHEQYLC